MVESQGRHRIFLVGLLLLALLAAACGDTAADTTTTAGSTDTTAPTEAPSTTMAEEETTTTAEAELVDVTIRADWFLSAIHAPFFVAMDKGWYAEQGLNVTYFEGQGSSSTAQQVASDTDTFGYATMEATLRTNASGADLVAVANILPRFGLCVLVPAESDIETPQDMEGRRIASDPFGSTTALFPAFIEAGGADYDAIDHVIIDSGSLIDLLASGEADGITVLTYSEPIKARDELENGGRCIEYNDYGADIMGHGIIVRRAFLDENPELVQGFVEATLRAFEYTFENPEEAIATMRRLAEDDSPLEEDQILYDSLVALQELRDVPELEDKPFGYIEPQFVEHTASVLTDYLDFDPSEVNVDEAYTNQFVPES